MGAVLAFLLCLPAAAQDDLGIPLEAPWVNPGAAQERAQEAEREKNITVKPAHPLADRFWSRLEEDLASLERWRAGMIRAVRYAESRPQIFPLAEAFVAGRPLFDEYVTEAELLWERAADYYLAVESLAERYAAFETFARKDPRRDAAYAALFAAYAARARFARDWTELARKDGRLEALFNMPRPALGLPAGYYAKLKTRYAGPEFAADSAAWRRVYRDHGRSKPLQKILGKARRAYDKRRADDVRYWPRAKTPRRPLAAVRAQAAPLTRFASGVGAPLPGGPREELKRPLLLPPPTDVVLSSRIAYAVDTLKHWLLEPEVSGPRPPALLSQRQLDGAAVDLRPGDLLLVRRGRRLGAIGLGGYWHDAGLFIGTPRQRAEIFAPNTPWTPAGWPRVLGPCFDIKPGARDGSPCVLTARPGGVVLVTLGRFADADAFAALRLKGRTAAQQAAALRRGLSRLGRRYDFLHDAREPDSLGAAEFLAWVYRGADGGPALSAEMREVAGLWAYSANMLAAQFDKEFATDREQLDFVSFYDAEPAAHRARRATLEEFRSSWRRPKWVLAKETSP